MCGSFTTMPFLLGHQDTSLTTFSEYCMVSNLHKFESASSCISWMFLSKCSTNSFKCSLVYAGHCFTVHVGMLHPHLWYCPSAVSEVCSLPMAICTSSAVFSILLSLLCSWSYRLITRQSFKCSRVLFTLSGVIWKLFFFSVHCWLASGRVSGL